MQVGSYGDLDQNVSVRQGEEWQDSQYSQKVKVESDCFLGYMDKIWEADRNQRDRSIIY